jgi:hypothetical protein
MAAGARREVDIQSEVAAGRALLDADADGVGAVITT